MYQLLTRIGSQVECERIDSYHLACKRLVQRVQHVQAGPMQPASNTFLRTFEADQLVKARFEIKKAGLFGRRVFGVDVRGDHSLVLFSGGGSRRPLDLHPEIDLYDQLIELESTKLSDNTTPEPGDERGLNSGAR